MQFPRSAAICAILVAAIACIALVTVRAQLSDIQPFTAVETQITRVVERPIPDVSTKILAVSGDGQFIAEVSKNTFPGRPTYNRLVWNKRQKTKIGIDTELKMLVTYPYHEPLVLDGSNWHVEEGHLTTGPNCEGTPDGQIDGFYVNRTEPQFGEDPSNPGGTTTEKRWAAPKLGCYVLRSVESKTNKDGRLVLSNIRTLTDIQIGEPDPSYFEISLPNGYTRATSEDYRDALINRIKAQRAQQGQESITTH